MTEQNRRSRTLSYLAGIAFALIVSACGTNSSVESSSLAVSCDDFAKEVCRIETACNSLDPCSFSCKGVPTPSDAEAFKTCVDKLEATVIPDKSTEPMTHLSSCAQSSSLTTSCLFLFAEATLP
jgi:hypothetical protein